jgi:hypothetical protein
VAQTLGPYTLGEPLGTLPFGELVSATLWGRTQPSTMLILSPELAGDPRFCEVLRREGAALRSLVHPGIARPTEVGQESETLYVLYALPPGQTLAALLASSESLSPESGLTLVTGLAESLDAAHRRGFVHGLLSPQSVLMTDDGAGTMIGLGILAVIDEVGQADRIGARTDLAYVAPEQTTDRHAVRSADGYALGALAHMLLTGVPPLEAVVAPVPLSSPTSHRTDDPTVALATVLRRQLAADPASRYPTCLNFASALDAVMTPGDPADEATIPERRSGVSVDEPASVSTRRSEPGVGGNRERKEGVGPTTAAAPARTVEPATPEMLAAMDRRRRPVARSKRKRVAVTLLAALGSFVALSVSLASDRPVIGLLASVGLAIFSLFAWFDRISARDDLATDLKRAEVVRRGGPVNIRKIWHQSGHSRTVSYSLDVGDNRPLQIDGATFERLAELSPELRRLSVGPLDVVFDDDQQGSVDGVTVIHAPTSRLILEIRDPTGQIVFEAPR